MATGLGISACMIVKNEEHLLGRCLKSFEGAFDELNIIDTGSTDATPAIAAQFGARVRRFTDCNGADGLMRDFALARNASLEMASHEWILWMDADDVLQPGGAERFGAAAARGGFAALFVTVEWLQQPFAQQRLFRNEPGHRFIGCVQEYISIRGKTEDDLAIRVVHLPDKRPGKNEPSIERNARIGELVAREDPTNAYNALMLGRALMALGRFDEAIVRFRQVGGGSPTGTHVATHSLAQAYYSQRRWRECIEAALLALRINPSFAETHYMIAECYREIGQPELARHYYLIARARACEPPPELYDLCDQSFASQCAGPVGALDRSTQGAN